MHQKHSIDFFYLGGNEELIAKELLNNEYVTVNDLITALYSGSDLPEYADYVVYVTIHRLRKKLAKQGLEIESSHRGGSNRTKYRLCAGQNKKKT